jgi:hypothetical protein
MDENLSDSADCQEYRAIRPATRDVERTLVGEMMIFYRPNGRDLSAVRGMRQFGICGFGTGGSSVDAAGTWKDCQPHHDQPARRFTCIGRPTPLFELET